MSSSSSNPASSAVVPPITSGAFAWAKQQTRQLVATAKQNPFWGNATIEFVGANLMSVACVGSTAERIEQCIMQFGNTAYVFLGGLGFDKVLDTIYEKTIPNIEVLKQTDSGKEWYKFGKTIGMMGYIIPFLLVLPKFRDLMTLKTTGAITFDEMTGYTSFDRNDPKHKLAETNTIHQKWHDVRMTMGTGMAAGLGLFALAGWALANKKEYPEFLRKIEQADTGLSIPNPFKKGEAIPLRLPGTLVGVTEKDKTRSIFLKDGKFMNFTGGNLMMTWVLPGYTGWLLEPRGILGVFEDVVKASWAVGSFSGLKGGVVNTAINAIEKAPAVDKQFDQWLGGKDEKHYFIREAIATALYAMPVLFSFHTRGLRAKLGGFKGKQHEIPAIPIEAYVDVDDPTTAPNSFTNKTLQLDTAKMQPKQPQPFLRQTLQHLNLTVPAPPNHNSITPLQARTAYRKTLTSMGV